MSGSEHARPVWLTLAQLGDLLYEADNDKALMALRDAYFAAPANPAEAVREAVQGTDIIVTASGPQHVALTRDEVARRVLRALGKPNA